MTTLNVESQQKVREDGPAPVASTSGSSFANQSTAQQALAAHLKEADPAMFEIIENASTLFTWSASGRRQRLG